MSSALCHSIVWSHSDTLLLTDFLFCSRTFQHMLQVWTQSHWLSSPQRLSKSSFGSQQPLAMRTWRVRSPYWEHLGLVFTSLHLSASVNTAVVLWCRPGLMIFFAPHHKHRTHLLSGWQAHSSFCCSILLQHNMEGRAVGWWAGGSAACIWILGFGYY